MVLRAGRLGTTLVLCALAGGPARAQGASATEPSQARSEGSAGAPEARIERVEGVGRLEIRGIRGEIEVRPGPPGELRWAASPLEGAQAGPEILAAPSPSGLRIGPAGEEVRAGCRLEVAVPPGLAVDVESDEGRFSATGLRSPVAIRGASLEVELKGIVEQVSVTIRGGKASLSNVVGDVEVYGIDLAVDVVAAEGPVRAGLEGGGLRSRDTRGGLEATLTGSTLVASGVGGGLVLRARGGAAEVSGLEGAATIEMEGASLKLTKSKGEIDVVTDGNVDLRETGGTLRVDASAGFVHASAHEGLLEIRGARDTRISVTTVAGPVRLEGLGLKAMLHELRGGVEARLADSSLAVDGLQGESLVDVEGGTVAVSASEDRLALRARGADVRLSGLRGPVDVDADGPRVQVAWAAIPQVEDSSVRNASGPVEIGLAGPGGCAIEARSRSGKVRSALPGLGLVDDGREARGRFGSGGAASIRIEAEGDIVLRGAGGRGRPPQGPVR